MTLPVVLERPELLPVRATPSSAGLDLRAAEGGTLAPGEVRLLSTGVRMGLAEGYVGLLFGRSSLGLKRGLRPANCVGVIDADFRGTLQVPMYNDSGEVQVVGRGERMAQIVIAPVSMVECEVVAGLEDVGGRAGGFGSTGMY